MKNLVNKTINLSLVGLDGNAYALIGAFVYQAKREGWNEIEIDTVIKEAKQGNYDHLVSVIDTHCSLKDSE